MNKVSVVTVSYNCVNTIELTIKSVINQSYFNVEYVVIDGVSNDGTCELISRYKDSIDVFVSEKDSGIYDAMNKSLNFITGDWILFMNSGDYFADERVLENIFSNRFYDTTDVIYGDTIVNCYNKLKYSKALPLSRISRCMPFSHQSVLVKSDLLRQKPFNLSYKIVADFAFFRELYYDEKSFFYHPHPISIYELISGVSAKQLYSQKKEIAYLLGQDKSPFFGIVVGFTYTISRISLFLKRILP